MMHGRILLIAPIARDIFWWVLLKWSVCMTFSLLKTIWGFDNISLFNITIPNVLPMFNVNLLILTHGSKPINQKLTSETRLFMSLLVAYNMVSSANSMHLRPPQAFITSLIYVLNNKDPSTEPCGTPVLILRSSDLCFLYKKRHGKRSQRL